MWDDGRRLDAVAEPEDLDVAPSHLSFLADNEKHIHGAAEGGLIRRSSDDGCLKMELSEGFEDAKKEGGASRVVGVRGSSEN